MHKLHTVYSTINNSPNSTLYLIVLCVGFLLAVSFCIIMYRGAGRNAIITLNTGLNVNPFLAALVPISFLFFIFAGIDVMNINVYQHDKDLLNSNTLKIVEGKVTNYFSEAKDGHGNEEFLVNGVLFHYSHFETGRSGYHQTAFYGGVIKPDLYVKISYYYDGDRNAILKLETE